ncbi:MAG: LytTR family DNA-binding domain-containing protein [Saprospiraceae bacterium]
MNLPRFTPTYADRLVRLIMVPILGILYRHIGEPSPLITLLRDPIYYIDLCVSILGIWFIWELAKWIIRRLDQRYSWTQDFFQRLVIQMVIAYGVTIFFTLFFTFLYNDIIMKSTRHELYDISFSFVIDVPVSVLIITIMQLLYYAMYLQEHYTNQLHLLNTVTAQEATTAAAPTRKNVLVYFGKSLLPVALEDIAYFHKVGEVTLARTLENQDYRIDQTLEQIQASVPASNFHRLNRQMIVNMEAVKEVKNDSSGKLYVILQPSYDMDVTVSRKKAADFKNWLNG